MSRLQNIVEKMKRSTRSTNNLKQSENEDNSRPNQGVEGFEKCLWPLWEYQQYDSVMVSHYRTVHKVEDIPKFRLNHDREKWYEKVKAAVDKKKAEEDEKKARLDAVAETSPGYFIATDSSFGNSILPVIPRPPTPRRSRDRRRRSEP